MSPVLSQSTLPQTSSLFSVLAAAGADAGDGAGAAVFTLTPVSLVQTEGALPPAPVSLAPFSASEKPPVSAADLLASLDRSARTAIAPAPILVAVDPGLPSGAVPPAHEEQPVVPTPVVAKPTTIAAQPVSQEQPAAVPLPVIEDLPVKATPPAVDKQPAGAKPGTDIKTPAPATSVATARLAADIHPSAGMPLPIEAKLPTDTKKLPTSDGDSDENSDDVTDGGMSQPAAPIAQPAVVENPVVAICMAAPIAAQAIVAEAPAATEVKAPRSPETKAVSRAVTAAPPSPPAAPVTLAQPENPLDIAALVLPKDFARTVEPKGKDAAVEVSVTMLSDMASDADTVPTFTLPTATSAPHALASASPVQQPVAAADVMINRHLDLARGDAWLDTLAQDIAAIAGTGDRLKFALQPEHLGKLDVEVSRHDNGVTVQMTTRNEEARAIIAAAQPRLLDELRANGTRVVAADVTSQMNAQTDGQSGNASRRPVASFIEAAIDVRTPAANTNTDNAPATGRYA